MPVTRRRLLAAGTTLVAAAASWGAWRALGIRAAGPAFPVAAPAPLPSPAMLTLLAAAEAAIGLPVDRGHYEEYFRWRAEHLPGYAVLYGRFAATLDREARGLSGRPYAAAPTAVRQEIPAAARRAVRGASLWDRLRGDARDPSWPLYDRYILGEALALFARTDAWVRLGYGAWPGVPRGLDRYRRPPA